MSSRSRAILLLAVAGAGAAAWALLGGLSPGEDEGAEATVEAERGPLVISVSESGTMKNREQVVLKSEVEGQATVLYLRPEGDHVKPGDLLVELDSSRLQEQKVSQQITVINTEASFVRARENLAVVKSQTESDVAQAELDLRFARLDLDKYKEGEYPQQLRQAEAEITIAREEVQRAKEKLEWSTRLHGQRYLSRTELQADELALKKAELDLDLAEGKKGVLEEYTSRRDLEALQSAIVQAESALDRTRRKASADVVQAEADLRAKESEYKRQQAQLEKLEDQIRKCRMSAPVAGMVVYATTGRGDRRGGDEPLQEGQSIRERQELIYLPTAAAMMAEVKVHESNLQKVRVGLPVRVTVDAVPGRSWSGKVVRIGVLPDPQGWMNPDLKLYNTEVHLDGDATGLRPGMNCRAEIYVDRYEDAVQVPVQCVVRVAGEPTVYVVAGKAAPEPRTVRIGLDNGQRIRIVEGLREREKVLLNPPLTVGAEGPTPEAPEIPAVPAQPAEKEQPEQSGAGTVDWGSLSREERQKEYEKLSPEERQKLKERFRRQRGGQPDEGRGG